MADYHCWPLWRHGGGEVGNIDPRTLGLSSELQLRLKQWAQTFESKLDWSDPGSVQWTDSDEEAFDRDGRGLTTALALELGAQFSVFYFDRRTASCLPVDELFVGRKSA